MASVVRVSRLDVVRRATTPWDAALAGALAVSAVVATLGVDAAHPALRAALGATTVLGVALRRKLPMAAAGIVACGVAVESVVTESPDEIPVLLALVIVAYSVAAHAPVRVALAGAGLLAMAVTVAIARDPSDSMSNVLPTVLLFVAVPAAIGMSVHRGQRNIAALTLETEALAREAEDAVELERRRIARELHDVVSHAVTLIAVQAEAGAAVIDTDPAEARRSLDAIGRVSREALAELHRLLGLLYGDDEGDITEGGLDRLPALVAGVRAAGLSVDVVQTGEPRVLPAAVDHCAFRILQEGLTNALRHAPSSQVQVRLGYDAAHVHLGVDSRGTRHSSAYGGTGRGLAGLRERVLGLGGTFDTDTTQPGAFSLAATLPVGAA